MRTIHPSEFVTASASVSESPTSDALLGVTHPSLREITPVSAAPVTMPTERACEGE